MSIPITMEVGALLLALFVGYMLYANWEGVRTRGSTRGKILYVSVVFAEVAVIVGERFVVPPMLGYIVPRESGLFDLLDIAVFIGVLLAVFAVGRRIKERIA